jgi:RHS repeat-associated protein
MRRTILALLVAILLPLACHTQPQTGTYAHGAFDAKGFDTINIGNLNVYFALPVLSKPGRGLGFYYNLAYNSSVWVPSSVTGTLTWTPVTNWGWTAETDAQTGFITYSILTVSTCLVGGHHVAYDVWGKFAYHDTVGVTHNFSGVEVSNEPTCSGVPSSDSATTNDPSGYTISVNAPGTGPAVTVTAISGKVFTAPSFNMLGLGSTVDSNGNKITINSSGQIEDTTGNVVLTPSGTGTPTSPVKYAYTDTSNTTHYVAVNYSSVNIQTAFGCSGVSEFSQNGVNLISSIGYDDGTSYSFSYEHTYTGSTTYTGRLVSVTLPEGGVINYSYSGGSNGIECSDGGTAILTRSMPNDPLTPSTSYTRTPGTNSTHTEVVDGLSNYGEYDFVNSATDPNYTPYLINYSQYEGNNTTGTLLISNQSCLNTATPSGSTGCAGQALGLPITAIKTTSTLNGTEEKYSNVTFNSYGLVTDDLEYDYGSGSYGAELSETQISYASLSNGIVGLPSTVTTLVPTGGAPVAVSTVSYGYDGNSLTSTSGLPQHNSVSGSRGNLTSVQYTTGASSPASITTAQYYYDDAGQLRTSKDEALNSTTYTYDSGTDAFLTGVSYPTTGSVSHSTSSTWDVIRGVKLTDVDLNSNTTTYTYDLMLRPYTISTPGGGYQTFAYSLTSGTPYTSVSTLHATGGSYITATSYLDPYGRLIKTDTTDTPSDDLVAYAYDADGNLNSVSNPYRSGGTVSNTVYTFDALARPTKIVDSDGSSQRLASYSGNAVTTTDEAGKQRELFIDGLGRTKEVIEPDSSGSLTLETDYLFSQNATAGSGSTFTTYQSIVNQKGGSGSSSNWRTRTFTYDMLGRTASESTPEAGLISYTYPNGSGSCAGIATLACGRTDANSTTTTYSYDALNRLTGKSYGGSSIGTGTPSVTYHYDQSSYNGLTISNSNGAMTGMSDSSGNITAWSFDGMRRVTAIENTINSVTKSASYSYNADGSTNTMQDYGGTTFTYSYDVSGRPTSIVDGSSNSYASGALYDAAGQLTSLNHQRTSGGGAYVRAIQYNNRLQPYAISATLNGTTIQSLTYGYGTSGTNNGNILTITNGLNSSRSQTYTYDYMNRLASGQDAGCNWGETYNYDNWGNLYQTTPISGCTGGFNWSVTPSTKNQLSNLTYDSAGEVTQDQYSNTFTYDAEGRILTGGGGTYVYDGAGNRVKKTVSGTTTLYWPGAGSILDESNSSGSTMGKQVRFAGLLVWHEDTSGNGLFLFHDHIGSIRVTGTASGSLNDDNDYQPFGTLYHNYGASPSNNIYLFTGDESDSETTSDYATFRNFEMKMGRFNRPDPYEGSYDPTNPQSLNRYTYAGNNPLTGTDPSGLVETAALDSGCTIDGLDAPCTNSSQVSGGGEGGVGDAYVQCPANDCGLIGTTVQGDQGLYFQLAADANGFVWLYFNNSGDASDLNGEDAGSAEMDEEGLQDLNGDSVFPMSTTWPLQSPPRNVAMLNGPMTPGMAHQLTKGMCLLTFQICVFDVDFWQAYSCNVPGDFGTGWNTQCSDQIKQAALQGCENAFEQCMDGDKVLP